MQTLKTETVLKDEKRSCHQLQAQRKQKHRSNWSLLLVRLIKKFKYHFDRIGLYVRQININKN